ncbi:hypothetical protein EDB86DRAFT_2746159, partial [Lactarius hatsudake]
VCLLDDIAVIVSRLADEAGQYLMAQRYSEHRMLTLIYKRMNEALGMLLHTILMRISRTNRTDVETPRASFG